MKKRQKFLMPSIARKITTEHDNAGSPSTTKHKVTVLLVVIAATVLIIGGCSVIEDLLSDDGSTTHPYVCENGIPTIGLADSENVAGCSACNSGYLLVNEECQPFSVTLVANVAPASESITISATATHNATLHWVVYVGGTTKDSAKAVISDATDGGNAVVTRSGTDSISVEAGSAQPITIGTLQSETDYALYVAIASGNKSALSAPLDFTTAQPDAPSFTDGPRAEPNSITQTSATVTLTANKTTAIYWVLYQSLQSSLTDLKSVAQGSVGGDVVAVSGGNDTVSANSAKNIPFSDLSPLTNYHFYALLEDSDGNQILSTVTSFPTIGYDYVCENGYPDVGQVDTLTIKCIACEDYYKPGDSNDCVATIYTCTNGDAHTDSTPQQEQPTVTDTNADVLKCKKCDTGYKLTDSNSCVALQYGERDTANEFNLSGSNGKPYGMWGNDTTVWAANDAGGNSKLFAYTLSTGARDTSKEFNLITTAENYNGDPRGIWSDGTTIWVAENTGSTGEKIFAYTLATGARDSDKEFNLDGENGFPAGIWSDGTTLWVVNDMWLGGGFGNPAYYKVFAYTLADGSRDSSKEFNLTGAQDDPTGMWSDGTTMWIADEVDHKLYAYTLATGNRDKSKEVSLDSANRDPVGIWSDGTTLWVADSVDDKLYAYYIKTE